MICRMVNGSFKGDPSEVPSPTGEARARCKCLRRLDRAACVVCGTVRSQRCNRCGVCKSNTPLRDLLVGVTFRDRRQPGHQSAAPGGAPAATSSELAASAPR